MRPLLLVEDGISYADTLRWKLRRASYTVDCVSGAQEALDYLHVADKPGLILLHCRQADPKLLNRLKQVGAPVVVISASGLAALGADAFLQAPVNDDDLLKTVQSHTQPNTPAS